METRFFSRLAMPSLWSALLVVWIVGHSGTVFADQQLREMQLKSAFLYRIAKFVKWPNDDHQSESFNFCIASHEAFSNVFKKAVLGKTVLNKPIVVKQVTLPNSNSQCHVLYSHTLSSSDLSHLLIAIKDQPILTIGSSDDFIQQGGIIRFLQKGNKLGFEINNSLATSIGLEINAHLLRLSSVK